MAVKIPQELQKFTEGKIGWVATASKDGMPNVSIKGTLRVLDDEHLLFADIFSLKTRKNLEENPKVAIMVYDSATGTAYSFKGSAELIAKGSFYDQTVGEIKKQLPQLPAAKYIVRITVEAIYNQSAGPEGGKQIA